MRLICPNCGAQYEVDGSVIPDIGRDVQCSNCGHTWFQRAASPDRTTKDQDVAEVTGKPSNDEDRPAEAVIAEADEEHLPEDEPSDDVDHLPEDRPGATIEAGSEHLPEDEADEEDEDTEADEAADDSEKPSLTPRPLDPEVADILREEAARETAERAEEAGILETQPDLGLDSGDDKTTVRERLGRMREQAEEGPTEDPSDAEDDADAIAVAEMVAASTRRDRLPDIEEINSTLTASSDRYEEDEEEREERRARSGFRRGFILAVLFFAVLALVYSYAPSLVEAYPAGEPALSAYVDTVNGLRLWVDGLLQQAVAKLTLLLGQVSGDSG